MLHASTIDRPLAIIVQAIAHYLSLLKHLALAFSPSVWPCGLRIKVTFAVDASGIFAPRSLTVVARHHDGQ